MTGMLSAFYYLFRKGESDFIEQERARAKAEAREFSRQFMGFLDRIEDSPNLLRLSPTDSQIEMLRCISIANNERYSSFRSGIEEIDSRNGRIRLIYNSEFPVWAGANYLSKLVVDWNVLERFPIEANVMGGVINDSNLEVLKNYESREDMEAPQLRFRFAAHHPARERDLANGKVKKSVMFENGNRRIIDYKNGKTEQWFYLGQIPHPKEPREGNNYFVYCHNTKDIRMATRANFFHGMFRSP